MAKHVLSSLRARLQEQPISELELMQLALRAQLSAQRGMVDVVVVDVRSDMDSSSVPRMMYADLTLTFGQVAVQSI